MSKYKIDMHTHTIASGHAYSTITENAHYAASVGIEYLGMTDHAPGMPGSCGALHFLNLKVIPEYIEGVRIFKGIEFNIMDYEGKLDKSIRKKIMKSFDIAIASLHLPCIDPGSEEENTSALINAMKNPFVNIIGHPGDPRYPINVKKVVTAARDTQTLLEINNSSFDPGNGRASGEAIVVDMLKECKLQEMPVILGSDAHYHTYIGNFERCEKVLEMAEFPEELVINRSTEEFDRFIKHKKEKCLNL